MKEVQKKALALCLVLSFLLSSALFPAAGAEEAFSVGYRRVEGGTAVFASPDHEKETFVITGQAVVWAEASVGSMIRVLFADVSGIVYRGYIEDIASSPATVDDARQLAEAPGGRMIAVGGYFLPAIQFVRPDAYAPAEPAAADEAPAAEPADEAEEPVPEPEAEPETPSEELPGEADEEAPADVETEAGPLSDEPAAEPEETDAQSKAPEFTGQLTDITVVPGGSAVLEADTLRGRNFQWQISKDGGETWQDLPNSFGYGVRSKKIIFTVTPSNRHYLYRCAASNGFGVSYSGPIRILLPEQNPITSQTSSISVNENDEASFSVEAQQAVAWQWQFSADNGGTWTDLTEDDTWHGVQTGTLSFPASAELNGFLFRCAVSSENTVYYSEAAQLNILGLSLQFTAQPEDKTVTEKETAVFSVGCTGEGAVYQWQYSPDEGETWTNLENENVWHGRKTDTLSVKGNKKWNGYLFRCAVEFYGRTYYSDAARITILLNPPVVTENPKRSWTVRSGKRLILKTAAKNAKTYQWQYSTDNGETWQDLTNESIWKGCHSAHLLFTVEMKWDQFMFRCMISNDDGTVYSTTTKLTVRP